MVIDSLNLNLSQISSFMHIYGFADFNGFVDLRILADFGFNYGFEDFWFLIAQHEERPLYHNGNFSLI